MIYVDGFRQLARVGRCRPARWSHLLADDRDELHDFAAHLGLKREWFQDHPVRWHYDVTDTARRHAITLGAVEVTAREVASLLQARRRTIFGTACGESRCALHESCSFFTNCVTIWRLHAEPWELEAMRQCP